MAGSGLDVDSVIERLLSVRGQPNNRTVQLAEGEIRALCATARCVVAAGLGHAFLTVGWDRGFFFWPSTKNGAPPASLVLAGRRKKMAFPGRLPPKKKLGFPPLRRRTRGNARDDEGWTTHRWISCCPHHVVFVCVEAFGPSLVVTGQCSVKAQ